MAPYEQDEAPRKRKKRKVRHYYPVSVFISQELLMGFPVTNLHNKHGMGKNEKQKKAFVGWVLVGVAR